MPRQERMSAAEARAYDPRSFWAESNTQCSIVSFLRRSLPPHYRVISIPNGRFQADPRTIARLKREGLTPGAWDLLVLRSDGWFAALEIKSGAGRLSPEQKKWSDWLSIGGGCQAVVRSLEEAIDALTDFGVPLQGEGGGVMCEQWG